MRIHVYYFKNVINVIVVRPLYLHLKQNHRRTQSASPQQLQRVREVKRNASDLKNCNERLG